MAKDPALLWYWGDWYSGTALMSRLHKGCYMDLLHAQFNNGPLSIEDIQLVLGVDFEKSWPVIKKKFLVNSDGLFYNNRLEEEKLKRKKFSQSRRENVKKRYNKSTSVDTYEDTSEKIMYIHMENENENRNKDTFVKGVQGEKLLIPEMIRVFITHFPNHHTSVDLDYPPSLKIAHFISKQLGVQINQEGFGKIIAKWSEICKRISEDESLNGKPLNYIYKSIQSVYEQRNSNKKGTSVDRVEALKKW